MSQLTYEELYKLIEKMTPAQRRHPVKMYTGVDGGLHPENESIHPEVQWSSKLILADEIDYLQRYNEEDYKNQYIILEYMTEEDDKKCEILHCRETLLEEYLDPDKKEEYLRKLKELGEDVSEYI